MKILNGNELAEKIILTAKDSIRTNGLSHRLDIIFIGDNTASEVYVAKKQELGDKVGVKVVVHRLISATQEEVETLLRKLANDIEVNGIIVQLPAPGVDVETLFDLIPAGKDVDGLNPLSLGLLWHDRYQLVPATAEAVILALQEAAMYEQKNLSEFLKSKQVLMINRSYIIGKPLNAILTNMDATVTMAHSKTANLHTLIAASEIIISGAGVPGLIKAGDLQKGAVVIDAGFKKDGKFVYGDVGKNDLSEKAAFLSPVPNGIGPVGVACLLENTVRAALEQKQNS
jgi:methylenetetrahydrofolate dehydrogenase (NADP+)/methenyltetrahydrofolate cyclohydrolase